MKLAELFPEKNSVLRRAAAEGTRVPRGAEVRNRQILLNGHVRRSAEQRVLKQAPDDAAPLMLRHKGDIQIVQKNLAVIHIEAARNRVEKGGLAGAVRADNRREIAVRQREREVVQRNLLVDRALVEGLL